MQADRLRRSAWYARIAAVGAVMAIAVLVLLLSSGGVLAVPRDSTSSAPTHAAISGTTVTQTVTMTQVETPQAAATATATVTVTMAPDAVTLATEQIPTTDAVVQAGAAGEPPAPRKIPVAALRFDNGLSADSLTSGRSGTAQQWVAASGKGMSYTGMTTGVAIAVGIVLVIGGLVVAIVARRRPIQDRGHAVGHPEYW